MFDCLFSRGSRRKDGHGRTEKLGLLTGMRGPSSVDVIGLWTSPQLPLCWPH